jgi:very-short-patch-repair endonuclease
VSRSELGAAVSAGLLVRPRNGIYCLPQTSSAILESLSHCGLVACVTAARDYGLWTLDLGEDECVHTWVDADHRPVRVALHPDEDVPACCVFHRDTAIDPADRGRVGILHALRQLLRCRGAECFFAALESALRQGLIDDVQRTALRGSLNRDDRWLVDLARTDADSGLESILRLRLLRHGLVLASQVRVPGVGIVDFVIGDCLILEADGATHGGAHRHHDLVRDAVAMSLGFVTLRFDSAMILHDWPTVEAAILAAVGRNLHRSHAGLTW